MSRESVRKDTMQLQSKQGAEVHFVRGADAGQHKSMPRGPSLKLNHATAVVDNTSLLLQI